MTRIMLPAAATCAALAMTFGGTAAAAPQDVTIGASSSGSSVTVTITNHWPETVVCSIGGYRDPDTPTGDMTNYEFSASPVEAPAGVTTPHEFAGVADGSYHIYWLCAPQAGLSEAWGTTPLIDIYRLPATAEPTPVTVTSAAQCSGSACLPTAPR